MSRRRVTRALSALFATWGAVQLAVPERVVRTLSARTGRSRRSWVVRLLGARMLAQHAVVIAAPDRPVLALSSAVDGLHAASMLLVAARSTGYRRVSLVSAGIAGAAALAGLLGAPRAQR